MSPEEKGQLVALLQDAQHWCQGAEARTAEGQPVPYTAAGAAAWDLTGAACHLFGLRRARELFVQIDRHLHERGTPDVDQGRSEIAAMVALQTWNDDAQTTHSDVLTRLQSLPVRALPVRAVAGDAPCLPSGDAVAEGTE